MFVVIPIGVLLYRRWSAWCTTRRWREEAERLGLNHTGAAPALTLNGDFLGVAVTVRHLVTERYKQWPSVTFVARAHLGDAARALDVPDPSPGADLGGNVIDDWFERSGPDLFGSARLEKHLLALVVAARQASKSR